MFGKTLVRDMINRSAENEADRRLFLKAAGVGGLGVVGAGAMTATQSANAAGPSDAAILNFALNLEYLEAEFYLQAAFGESIPPVLTTGRGRRGRSTGGRQVKFSSRSIRNYAVEIAKDELLHVKLLRTALGGAKVSQPTLNLKSSFTAAAQAAGLIKPNQTFDPYANENNFLLAAYIFEDVGVTAYKGAAPLINNKTFLSAAAGLLSVEAYHAGIIRTSLYEKELFAPARKISAARDSLDGNRRKDQGIGGPKVANLVPANGQGLAFNRTAGQVLNIVYLNPKSVGRGGFFPAGVNGPINTSASSA